MKKARRTLMLTIMTWLFISSSWSLAAEGEKEKVLLIVGETVEETTVSGIELELWQQNADGSVGEKVGSFVSEAETTGAGHINLNLKQGAYIYRILSPDYVLPKKATWADFVVEAGENTILVWVEPREDMADGQEKTESSEKSKEADKPSGAKGEISGTGKGEFNVGNLIFGTYGGIGITLILLLLAILGVVGLDYRMRRR